MPVDQKNGCEVAKCENKPPTVNDSASSGFVASAIQNQEKKKAVTRRIFHAVGIIDTMQSGSL
jgi:hypothetical protein